MTAEIAPREQIDPFVSALSEIVGPKEKGREVQVATKSLRHLDLGIIHDPRPFSGRMMLILQEKKPEDVGIARQTVRVELYANRFKVIPYVSREKVEDELRMQLEYIDIQNESEDIDLDQRYDKDEIDDIALRWSLAGQERDEIEKDPTPEDMRDIRKGLNSLTGRLKNEWRANRKLSKFFNRQFE